MPAAYTQADLDALRAAYVSGVLEVEYAGRRTRFQSSASLRAIIAEVEAVVSPSTATPGRTVGAYSSGLQTGVLDPRSRRC